MACEKSDCLIVVMKRMKVCGMKGAADTHFCAGETWPMHRRHEQVMGTERAGISEIIAKYGKVQNLLG